MMSMLPKKYATTDNKERVRVEDTGLIKKEYVRKKRKLTYLGMPSGEMRDILAWKDYFEKCTAVEIDDQMRNQLMLNVINSGLNGKISILYGDIEKILIKGSDEFNNKLQFPYDVVFLDCFGTIVYRELQRVKAITSLIEKQKGSDFLLLLTFNIRERKYCDQSIGTVLNKIEKELLGYYLQDDKAKLKINKIMGWYKADKTEEMYRQKIFGSYFIKTMAEERGFKVHVYPPIFYLGFKGSPMIHFAFKLMSGTESPTKEVSDQTIFNIINLNIKEVSNGRVFVRKQQAPTVGM
ncbi:hypothetical protein HY967_00640 [Candidatus Jorgensenbacteria bacterium]|nr:hypothetical protein [Candidatus Jorgensenbacteria bacterium]